MTSLESIKRESSDFHTLTTVYLIANNTKAFALVGDESTAQSLFHKLSDAYESTLGPFRVQKISAFVHRIQEIGRNLFERKETDKIVSSLSNQNILQFRNTIINEFIHRCSNIPGASQIFVWRKIQKKYEFLQSFETMDEFNQYIIDILKFIRRSL